MIDVLHSRPFCTKSSLVPAYDDVDANTDSDITVVSSAQDGVSLNGCLVDSDRRSVNSYTSSIDREFILKDIHGRVINATSQAR